MTEFEEQYAWYAPGRLLKNDYPVRAALNPQLLNKTAIVFLRNETKKYA